MSLALIGLIALVGFIVFAVVVSKVRVAIDSRSSGQVKQEMMGVGADQKEDHRPSDKPTLMG